MLIVKNFAYIFLKRGVFMLKKLLTISIATIIASTISLKAFAIDSKPEYTVSCNNSYSQSNSVSIDDIGKNEYEEIGTYNNIGTDETDFSSLSSGSSPYYYNSGLDCPKEASYGKYNLLDNVKKGDVLFDAKGGHGITGHISIVEGIFTSKDGTRYIRIIEAIGVGVVRGILDDNRIDEREVTVLRVAPATEKDKEGAVNFCISQLGKSYRLDFTKDTSPNEKHWYCSELVWASYKNQNIDIEDKSIISGPGVTPRDVRDCKLTVKVAI